MQQKKGDYRDKASIDSNMTQILELAIINVLQDLMKNFTICKNS
jgi:hypothetical protein